jgi:hypothetical protein
MEQPRQTEIARLEKEIEKKFAKYCRAREQVHLLNQELGQIRIGRSREVRRPSPDRCLALHVRTEILKAVRCQFLTYSDLLWVDILRLEDLQDQSRLRP